MGRGEDEEGGINDGNRTAGKNIAGLSPHASRLSPHAYFYCLLPNAARLS